MTENPKAKHSIAALVVLILAGETIFFLPFVLARIFRPTILRVFEITNFELGTFFSAYGVVAMVSYFFGGPLADRFHAKYLIAAALIATGLGGVFLIYFTKSHWLFWLYAYWGFTTIFLFWAALIKATREWGGDDFQGKAFGFLEGGRGLTAALIGMLSLYVFSQFDVSGNSLSANTLRLESFRAILFAVVSITMVVALLVLIFVPKQKNRAESIKDKISLNDIMHVLKMPQVWLNAIIILTAYVGYKITDDYSLYANEVLGFSEVQSAGIGATALWLRPLFAVMAGVLADRLSATKTVLFSFGFTILGAGLIASGLLNSLPALALILLGASLAGIYGIRGIYFALMQEAKIPLSVTGTAVGIISVLGYTPDVFISPLMGYILDRNPGALGHQFVFAMLVAFSIFGLIAALAFKKSTSRLAA